MNSILCGMPGSGKSYFGKMAAKDLHRKFIDTDELVMSEYEKIYALQATCREITLREGEIYFRDLESQVIRGLSNTHHSIIAIGGGTLSTPENVCILKNLGRIIYLKTAPLLLLDRLKCKDILPSYLDPSDIEGSFMALLQQRLPLYEQYCDECIETSSENVLEIIKDKYYGK